MLKKIVLLLVCFFVSVHGAPKKKKTICLNMIVKDESPVIERCLKSVKGIIDYWVISDTGSTDGTQEIIKNCMKDIPGQLIEEPWQNFEYNRNFVLNRSKDKGDYILFIDADERLVFEDTFKMPDFTKDYYIANVQNGAINCKRVLLINNHLDWYWKGVLHEDILCDSAKTCDLLEGVTNKTRPEDGNRSADPLKYHKDVALLEKALEKEPDNSRYIFYLGESSAQIGEYEKALKAFEKRVTMGGWDEEVFWSHYSIAKLKEVLERPKQDIIDGYTKAYLYRPKRAEPLYKLASYYRKIEDYFHGYLVLKFASEMPIPKEGMFMENWVYEYGMLMELSNCAYCIGKFSEAAEACNKILSKKDIPLALRKRIEENQKCALNQSMRNRK